ncbi:MAG: hypothetical protein Q9220_002427 [cf. Caloplaca sp. 1 TL-2023]
MFSKKSRSEAPVEQQQPQEATSSMATTHVDNSDSRSSTTSGPSITDVEAGFLAGDNSRRKQWKDALGFRFLFRERSNSSDSEAPTNPAPTPKSKKYRWICLVLLVLLTGVIASFLALEIPHHSRKYTNGADLISSRWGLPSPSTQKALTTWPTDFSRDITPIPCHSHNDYWRKVPLYDALAAGCTGVEADVWLDDKLKDDLYVGHTRKSLTSSRTLNSLYINPLLTILRNQNAASNISTSTEGNSSTKAGVFDTSPSTPLTLLIDLKTPSSTTFPLVLALLQPLLKENFLTTYYPATGLVPGPITAVATGNTNFSAEILSPANSNPRILFFDAPLASLGADDEDYSTNNSYYASTSFDVSIGKPWMGVMTPSQVRQVRRQVQEAGERGLRSRYWDTPSWPRGVEEGVWDVLTREGVGMLSVDDLVGVRGFWEGVGRSVVGKGVGGKI